MIWMQSLLDLVCLVGHPRHKNRWYLWSSYHLGWDLPQPWLRIDMLIIFFLLVNYGRTLDLNPPTLGRSRTSVKWPNNNVEWLLTIIHIQDEFYAYLWGGTNRNPMGVGHLKQQPIFNISHWLCGDFCWTL